MWPKVDPKGSSVPLPPPPSISTCRTFRSSPSSPIPKKNDDLPAADWLLLAPGGAAELPAFAEFLKRGEPLCGRLQPEKLDYLFGGEKDAVQSSVLMPVGHAGMLAGMLAIGSGDAHRFHPGMGTVFLKLIAETIDAAIARYS